MPHPCISGPNGNPCGVYVGPDRPWGKGNCRLCYLYATSRKHRRAWDKTASRNGTATATRTEPCRFKGETLRDADGRARTREVVTGYG